jgi:hypothetical protein
MESRRVTKAAKKDKGLLISFARTIGSTLGTMAAKTDILSKPARRRTASRKSGSMGRKAPKKNKA